MKARYLALLPLLILVFAFHPGGASAAVNGTVCSSNAECDSNYCNLSGGDLGTCQTPGNPGPGGNTNTTPNPGPGGNTSSGVQLLNPLKSGTSLSDFLSNILKFVVEIGSIVVVLMLVYVGFLFVTARGNDSKITAAREALLWTVVGALVLLGAQAIAMGIQATVTALGG